MNNYNDKRGHIKSEVDKQGIATVLFYHPLHNSFPSTLLNELAYTIKKLGNDENVHLIILKSEGERTFCSGASFDELLTIETREAGKVFFSGFAHVINAIRLCNKIVVGQVQGKAIGGGVGLAAACDYCFATDHASIRLSELGINIGPFVIAPAVERKIGLAAITTLTLNPDDYQTAQWAKEHGLFQEIYPDIETMNEAVNKFCIRLSGYNIEALKAIKEILWQNTDHWSHLLEERADISGRLTLTKETKASLQAFKKKD